MEMTNTIQTQETLIDRVIGSIKDDLAHGDETVLDELLGMVPGPNLIMALPEEVWPAFGGVSPEYQGQYGGINAAFDALKETMNAAIEQAAKRLADRELIVFTSAPDQYLDVVESEETLVVGDTESVLINYAPRVSKEYVFGLCNRGALVERESGTVELADMDEMSLNEKLELLAMLSVYRQPVTISETLWDSLPALSVFENGPVLAF